MLCFSRDGAPKDVKFNVFFATPNPTLAYAWADQPAGFDYSPSSLYRSNPSGGPVTAAPIGVGQHLVTFHSLSLLDGGDVQVTAYGPGNIICKVQSWIATKALVRCFDPRTNASLDSRFVVMFFS